MTSTTRRCKSCKVKLFQVGILGREGTGVKGHGVEKSLASLVSLGFGRLRTESLVVRSGFGWLVA